ncbi:sensor histidine kinase [Dyella sp.]|uniref:sensor histidine kinase n=1 Tax=Dyella sp. TaxID=1869338 RepID=UPI002ED44203
MPVTRIERKRSPSRELPGHSQRGDYTLIEALPWPCVVFDRLDGHVLANNAAFRHEFSHLPTTLTRAAFDAEFEAAGNEDDGAHTYYALSTRRWYRMEHRDVRVGDHADAYFMTNISDCIEVLRRHRAQHEQLISTSRMMSVGEMASTLAHELNQPLAAAVNYLTGCEQIAQDGSDSARLVQGIRLARRQTERAAQVIASIREFVRSREPHRQNLDARELVRNVTELLRLEAEQFRVSIINELPEQLPPIFADRVMIEQVLLNLIKNAIEAMRETPPSRRRIRVSARLDYDDMIEIRVTDQGCGIDQEGMQRLFTPLYTTKSDGLGIGLAICRSIIEYHEGRLFAEPAHEGRGGCAMVFTLPRGLSR